MSISILLRGREHPWQTRSFTSRSSARTRTTSGATSASCSAGASTAAPVAEAISEPSNYGFVDRVTTPDGTGIPGGVGGGAGYPAHVIFYVGVADVEAALREAERLGGKRQLGPERAPTGLVIGHFTDPEGNLVGVAGPA